MEYTRLESNLAKVKKELDGVKKVNTDFFNILDELDTIKTKASSDPKTMDSITKEFKDKAIIDLFSSIEKDFDDLRNQLTKQELYRERISDFVESLRTKKTFSFEETTKTILFLEGLFDSISIEQISIKPQYIGTIDLTELAIDLNLYRNGNNVVFQKEQLPEVLSYLISKRMFRNIIFETNNARIFLTNSNEVKVETDNTNIRKISRVEIL